MRVCWLDTKGNIVKIFNTKDSNFSKEFKQLLQRGKMDIDGVSSIVKNILDEIKSDGNSALKSHISRFDNWTSKNDSDLEVSLESMEKAYNNIDSDLKDALHLAYERIESYHQKLMPK